MYKHHGKEAYAKYVEEHNQRFLKDPGICQVCGQNVENQRVHLMAWHPEIAAPKTFNTYLSKNIRRLSQKPRWAERLNKRQKVLSDEGKLPPSQDDGGNLGSEMTTTNAIENPVMNK